MRKMHLVVGMRYKEPFNSSNIYRQDFSLRFHGSTSLLSVILYVSMSNFAIQRLWLIHVCYVARQLCELWTMISMKECKEATARIFAHLLLANCSIALHCRLSLLTWLFWLEKGIIPLLRLSPGLYLSPGDDPKVSMWNGWNHWLSTKK